MVCRAEQLADTFPDSTASLIDSVLRMPVYFNERQRMDMALLQGEALFRDAALDDDDFLDSVATSPELERAADYYAKNITSLMGKFPYVDSNLLATYDVEIRPYRGSAYALSQGNTTAIRVYLAGYANAANGVEPVLHYVWLDNDFCSDLNLVWINLHQLSCFHYIGKIRSDVHKRRDVPATLSNCIRLKQFTNLVKQHNSNSFGVLA